MLRLAMPSEREKRAIQKILRPVKFQKKNAAEMDDTEYLMSDPVQWKILLERMEDVENGRNIIYRDLIEP